MIIINNLSSYFSFNIAIYIVPILCSEVI